MAVLELTRNDFEKVNERKEHPKSQNDFSERECLCAYDKTRQKQQRHSIMLCLLSRAKTEKNKRFSAINHSIILG